MKFKEFEAEIKADPNFGKDPKKFPAYTRYLEKLGTKEKAKLIAHVLGRGEAGIQTIEGVLTFFPLTEADKHGEITVPQSVIDLVFDPAVSDEAVHKILGSEWMKYTNTDFLSEACQWVFAYLVFPKHYASLFIEALQAGRPFTEWRGIPCPSQSTSDVLIELKPLILKVLKSWPTSGRSGYALLSQLRETNAIKTLADDTDIQKALDDVEGHCDFGSLEKVRSLLK